MGLQSPAQLCSILHKKNAAQNQLGSACNMAAGFDTRNTI